MIYEYKCEECEELFDREFPMGKAKNKVDCDICGGCSLRHYSFTVAVPNPISEARRGRGQGRKTKKKKDINIDIG